MTATSRTSLLVSLLGGVVLVAFGLLSGDLAGLFRAYLIGYSFWLGLGLGCLGMVAIQFLTGGVWGLATRRIFEAGASSLPIMAVLFLPLLAGLPDLYVWARAESVASDPILQHTSVYLNVPFFVTRAVLYLVSWSALALVLARRSHDQDRAADPRALLRLQRFSIVAALVLALTVSFAAIDWLMSLDADWSSTMYPPMIAMGDLLAALALGIIVITRLSPRSPLGEIVTPRLLNDLGSLLLAFLMLWAYMAYFQYLLVWAGNLTDEIPWYLRRVDGGWRPVAIGLAVLGFAVPFVCLLFRGLKRSRRWLARVAGLIFVLQIVNLYWFIEPPFTTGGPRLSGLPLMAVLAFGGLWVGLLLRRLDAEPLLPPHDPRLLDALEAAREPA
jgi:hypothetical protein